VVQGARRTTIKDIARAAGVSIAAVSFVLNKSGSVGAEVRSRVLAAAETLGYRPNQSAQAMRTGKSRTLGLLLPDLRNPFFAELAHAVGNSARDAGYAVLLVESDDGRHEKEGLAQLAAYGVDGICWCPSSKHDIAAEIEIGVPAVAIDRPLPKRDWVTSNYAMGGALLALHIVASDRAPLGLVNGLRSLPGTAQRRRGLVAALAGRVPIAWSVETPFATDLDETVLAALARREARIIACGNDMIAIGVVRALGALGVRVPEDVAVLGFDDISWAVLVDPELTTIRQPLHRLGTEAIHLLMRRIATPDAPIRRVQLDVELVRRRSGP
jgi:LacI family transcriptional regulator